MTSSSMAGVRIHVHASGNRDLDGILRLIEAASQNVPLEEKLAPMCADVAAIAGCEVASIYVRERGPEGDMLVMRANVGFSGSISGARLKLGEGLTGFVADCLRPVSAAIAREDTRFVLIPDLGEERFPSYLGVPLIQGGVSVGALVLQRSEARAFSPEEVMLATALAAPFAAAIDRERQNGKPESNGRAVRLRGVPVIHGAAMGRAAALPTLSALKAEGTGAGIAHPDPSQAAAGGLESLQRDLERADQRLGGRGHAEIDRALANLRVILTDRRFRERLLAETASRGLVDGLDRVARDYARVPYLVAGRGSDLQTVLSERARELEDLCVLVLARTRDHRFLEPGAVLVAQRLGIFATLAAVSRGVKAIVVEEPVAAESASLVIAAAENVPVVAQVTGLFAWVRPRDLMVVNARGGSIDINPSVSQVARFRNREITELPAPPA